VSGDSPDPWVLGGSTAFSLLAPDADALFALALSATRELLDVSADEPSTVAY